jgi:hypothetical protein
MRTLIGESGVLPRSWSEVAIPMVFSLAILMRLGTIALRAHVCGPLDLFRAEARVSVAGLSVGLARRSRRRPDGTAQRPEQSREQENDEQGEAFGCV